MNSHETKSKLKALDEAWKAGILTEEEYNQKREMLLRQKTETPEPAEKEKKGRVYRHPLGFSLWHSGDWIIQTGQSFLQLVPGDQAVTSQGPKELFFLVAEPLAGQGIAGPQDPRVELYLDIQVKSLSFSLTRRGKSCVDEDK